MPLATPFLQFGNTRFEAEQTHAYVRWACAQGLITNPAILKLEDDCGCWADSPIVGEPFSVNDGEPWVDPDADGACWIDPGEPASYEFLGFAPYIVDYGAFPRTQAMTGLTTGGGRPAQPSIGARSIRVVGTLYAASEAGAAFGQDWLHRVFADDCGGDCVGQTLTIRRFCPAPDGGYGEGIVNVFDCIAADIQTRDWADTLDPYWWMTQEVEITIMAGRPWLIGCEGQPIIGVASLSLGTAVSNIERFVSPDVQCGQPLPSSQDCPSE